MYSLPANELYKKRLLTEWAGGHGTPDHTQFSCIKLSNVCILSAAIQFTLGGVKFEHNKVAMRVLQRKSQQTFEPLNMHVSITVSF